MKDLPSMKVETEWSWKVVQLCSYTAVKAKTFPKSNKGKDIPVTGHGGP
jgi:hypothetical protein